MIKLNAIKCLFFTIICFSWINANAQEQKTILAFGDSLFSATRLESGESFPAQLQDKLESIGQPTRVIEAGFEGFTTTNALEIIEQLLDDNPSTDLIIFMFGGNDYFNNFSPDFTRDNMDQMLKIIGEKNIPVLMAGLVVPYNGYLGFNDQWNDIYLDLAEKHNATLDPFFLEGVAGVPELNQADGIHPNKYGNLVIAERITPMVDDMLTQIDQYQKIQALLASVDTSIEQIPDSDATETTEITPLAAEIKTSKNILVFGDSLVAGLGLDPELAFPAQLEAKLNETNPDIKVFNAGVSGDTSSAGMARLEWVLNSYEDLDLVIVLFGGNDALRGIHPDLTRRNMDRMAALLKQKNLPTLIAGMMAPPNLGEIYANNFNTIYGEVAKKYEAGLYPFYLDGVAGVLEYNQNDRIHPNDAGVKYIVERISPVVYEMVSEN